jgi:hypothetical protein
MIALNWEAREALEQTATSISLPFTRKQQVVLIKAQADGAIVRVTIQVTDLPTP